jgi:hypothetical protein
MSSLWAHQYGVSALALLRCCLIARCASISEEVDLTTEAANARSDISELFMHVEEIGATPAALSALLHAGDAVSGVFVRGNADEAADPSAYKSPADEYEKEIQKTWDQVAADATILEQGGSLLQEPLWTNTAPTFFATHEQKMLSAWDIDPPGHWDFWYRWWCAVRDGQPFETELQFRVVKGVYDRMWRNPHRVAERIHEIEEELEYRKDLPQSSSECVEIQVARTKAAMERNRRELPPAFEQVLGFIALEVDRLQKCNYLDEVHKDECVRQISVLTDIAGAVGKLEKLVPKGNEMPEGDAEQAERLSRVYLRKHAQWARSNVVEMTDSTYRFGLVAISTMVFNWIGVPPREAFYGGMAIFAGEKIAKQLQSARRSLSRSDEE